MLCWMSVVYAANRWFVRTEYVCIEKAAVQSIERWNDRIQLATINSDLGWKNAYMCHIWWNASILVCIHMCRHLFFAQMVNLWNDIRVKKSTRINDKENAIRKSKCTTSKNDVHCTATLLLYWWVPFKPNIYIYILVIQKKSKCIGQSNSNRKRKQQQSTVLQRPTELAIIHTNHIQPTNHPSIHPLCFSRSICIYVRNQQM